MIANKNLTDTSNLHLIPNDKSVKINRLLDWYNYQVRYIINKEITDDVIFTDDDVELYATKIYTKRKLVTKGKMELYKDKLVIGETTIPIGDIRNASPTGDRKMGFSIKNQDYFIVGPTRFNPLKYIFMFNKLETEMKQTGTDIYYNLEERKM